MPLQDVNKFNLSGAKRIAFDFPAVFTCFSRRRLPLRINSATERKKPDSSGSSKYVIGNALF